MEEPKNDRQPTSRKATGKVVPLVVEGQTIYVETVEVSGLPTDEELQEHIEGLAQPVGFVDTMGRLAGAISGIGEAIKDAASASAPDEFAVELAFGLKGEGRLVPVLLSGSTEGSIKVSLKWTSHKPREGG